jgi:hypothetical protein
VSRIYLSIPASILRSCLLFRLRHSYSPFVFGIRLLMPSSVVPALDVVFTCASLFVVVRVVIDLRVVRVLHWEFTRSYRGVFFGVTSILHCERVSFGDILDLRIWILEIWNLEVCSTNSPA